MSVTTETQTALAPAAPRALVPLPRHDFGSNLPAFPPNALLDAAAPHTRGPLIFGLLIFIVFVLGFRQWSGGTAARLARICTSKTVSRGFCSRPSATTGPSR